MDSEKPKMLALTFDDGPSTGTMSEILELLDRYDARATFFVVGDRITPETAPVLRAAADGGHEIGNHSRSHGHMPQLDRETMRSEVASVQQLVQEAAGIRPSLFRPPYLDVSPEMLRHIDMPMIGGTGNRDWEPAVSAEARFQTAVSQVEDGAIVLMHCFENNEATVLALKMLLPELKGQGYQLVTVSELFRRKQIPLEKGRVYTKAAVSAV